ncbi:polyunsaturated fatty acid lipoxygenase ALOX15B-like isoform X2 [Hypomesus transpacificus]|uniref:polyunsaturated fatty acid lipoxygenase ALOX15B-like isoform X2 n=1 Tax=Hypomesus transpacificus TaxID=137520 RepID=UPI001F077169|nr:polyunsaturated fatty acid lipoxygenase ALOX15B-like isoform X2 [Hypomesus transpacificus]
MGKSIGDAGNEETEKEMETAVTVVPWSNAETIGADTMGAPGLEHLRRTSVTQSAMRALVTNHGGKHKSEPLEEIIPAKRAFDDINPLVVSSTQMFRRTMAYWVTVFTGDLGFSGTFNPIYIKLVGTDGESERLRASPWIGFRTRQEYTFPIECPTSLGDLLVVELDKKPLPLTLSDNWFCAKVTVRSETPENDTAHFPIYRWISDNKVHYFREGKAKRVFDDINPLVKSCRKKELKERAQDYRWDSYKQGLPDCMKSEGPSSLPLEVQFSYTKEIEFRLTAAEELKKLWLEGLINLKEPWKSIDDMRNAFSFRSTHLSDYVQQHWREDKFFGYQFLNGINPMIIQRCSKLPENFPVTNDMVRASLHGARSLTDQIKKGNIYLVDYKQLDGVTANVINGKQQYLTAPLVLLQKTPDHKLIPIAIQLKQKPGEDNPVFFPTDSEYDWLLAKIFVRSANFNDHELNVHLLRTHLLSEVFAVALLRNFPMVHPLYKLLVPHTRYTLQINTMARAKLISKDGVFTQYSASGGEGMFTILQRELSSLTYSSLCLPEDIAARGLESIPNFYYRDDGLRLWDVIHRFVQGVIGHYYKSDLEVKKDSELQNWIKDIFLHGFLSRDSSGIPESFKTVAELVKFVTMVIFTGSAQHSAVNTGQFDYGGWPLNSPISLQLPPPTTKGQSSESTMLQTLADVNCTALGVGTVSLLSTESTDFVPLGEYPHEHFSEDAPCRLIKGFQAELKTFSESVKARNSSLEVPYTYLDPEQMENSVAL